MSTTSKTLLRSSALLAAALLAAFLGGCVVPSERAARDRGLRFRQALRFDLKEALEPRKHAPALHRARRLKGRELRLVAHALDGDVASATVTVMRRGRPYHMALIDLPWDRPSRDPRVQQQLAQRLTDTVQRIVQLTGKRVALRMGPLTAIPEPDGVAVELDGQRQPLAAPPPPASVAPPAPRPAPAPAPAHAGGTEITAGCDSPSDWECS